MPNPAISVVIPVYNGEKYLAECLDSLISQTFKDFEIICVNDGSTDKSLEILKKYSYKNSKIRIINQKNSGAGAARNNGLNNASGDYLSVLDCDDLFDPDMIESLYKHALKYDTDITFCKARILDNKTKIIKNFETINFSLLPDKEVFSAKNVSTHIFQIDVNWCWNKLYKMSFVKENNFFFQTTKVHNDTFFAAYTLTKTEKMSALNKTLCTYRTNVETSATYKKIEYPLSFYEALILLKDYLVKDNTFGLFKQSFANFAMYMIFGYYKFLSFGFKKNFLKNMGIKNLPSNISKRKYFFNRQFYFTYIFLSHSFLIPVLPLFYKYSLRIKNLFIFTKNK